MKAGESPGKGPVGEAERRRRSQVQTRKDSRLEKRGESPAPPKPARAGGGVRFSPEEGYPLRKVRSGPSQTEAKAKVMAGPAVRTKRFCASRGRTPSYRVSEATPGEAFAGGTQSCRPFDGKSSIPNRGNTRVGRQDGSTLRRKPVAPARLRRTAVKPPNAEQPAAGNRESGIPAESRRRGAISRRRRRHRKRNGTGLQSMDDTEPQLRQRR